MFVPVGIAEFDTRGALGGFTRHPASLEIVGAVLDVTSKLVVHLALERRAMEEIPADGAKPADYSSHIESAVALSAAVMPAVRRSQPVNSLRNSFRPAGVSE